MRTHLSSAALAAILLLLSGVPAVAQKPKATPKPAAPKAAAPKAAPFEPRVGQEGKDVVWVPSPQALVDRMLEMAKLTPNDFLMDLGSGDGITVITAAQRGARALGVEYEAKMVEVARRNAETAGVTGKATFVQGDLFESDLTKADVITMFLLPSINMRLRPTLLDLKPGTRIVSNTFDMEDWEADETRNAGGTCTSWCTALLWIVPAKVEGTWQTAQGDLVLTQRFQMLSGSLGGAPITSGRMRGTEMSLLVSGKTYIATLKGTTMTGTGPDGAFTATRK